MTNPEESHEAQLLRLLIAYFHVSLLHQLSLTRHSKPFDLLGQPEKDALTADLMGGVISIAQSVTPAAVQQMLSSLPMPPSKIQ
jgi:hypothetical protein